MEIKEKVQGYRTLLLSGVLGILIGAVIGGIDGIFGRVLLDLTEIRGRFFGIWTLLLPLAGVGIVWCYEKYGKNSKKGMGLIFSVGNGKEEEIPLRMVPLVIGGTWLTHLFGGSAGREGVAVQVGGVISYWIGKRIPCKINPRIFLVAGMAAGFSGLFSTPIAAVFFSMEVLDGGKLKYQALCPAVTAAFTACTVSGMLGLEKFTSLVQPEFYLNWKTGIIAAALGIVFGAAGGGFAWGLGRMKKWAAEKFANPMVRILVLGFTVSLLIYLLGHGRYAGLGTNLIQSVMDGEMIYRQDWVLKMILTIVTLSAGFQGGEVTPLFSIGACLGAVLAPMVGFDSVFAGALGYAGVFAGATHTLLAPIWIGAEVFGYENLPWFMIVCVFAYLFNGGNSIYGEQKGTGFFLKQEIN